MRFSYLLVVGSDGGRAANGLNKITSLRRPQMFQIPPSDHVLLNIRCHCELPVAANLVDPSGMAKSHCFLHRKPIPGGLTPEKMSGCRFILYSAGSSKRGAKAVRRARRSPQQLTKLHSKWNPTTDNSTASSGIAKSRCFLQRISIPMRVA
jgi:hypothetical protein